MSVIKTYNIAIIGYGAFGRFLKKSWERLGNVQVLWITRTTQERAQTSAEAEGIPKYTSRYHDVLSDPEVDIVVVATPPYMHAEQAVAALRAGKHVLIEKPLATDIRDGERILQAAKEFDRKATVNFIMRYNPIVEKVKRVVDGQFLGKLYRTLQENYASSQGLNPDHWFWDISKSGGIMVEHGVHFFDMVNWMTASEPETVQGLLTSRSEGMEDKVMANVEYSNGALATFYNSFSRPAMVEKTWGDYVFDRGEITTEGWIPLKLVMRGFVSESEFQELLEVFPGAGVETYPVKESDVESGGRSYHVDHEVEFRYALDTDKEEVYAQCAADLLADFLHSIEDPEYQMRVTLDDALRSLKIAVSASSYRKTDSVYQTVVRDRM